MLFRPLVFISLILASGLGFLDPALGRSSSAKRPPGVPAELMIRNALEQSKSMLRRTSGGAEKGVGTGPVVWAKSSFDKAIWSRVPAMSDTELQASFEMVREEKFFTDEAARKRRATWLYPDDGCFVRATVADDMIAKLLSPPTSPGGPPAKATAKIFAFGNLQVQTANSPSGFVEWWYHVAAISKVTTATSSGPKDEFYVYDPAINPKAPMPVKAWLSTMGDPGVEIAICAAAAYDPYSICEDGVSNSRQSSLERAYREAGQFLPAEWDRLEVLGRDPQLELGSNPPW